MDPINLQNTRNKDRVPVLTVYKSEKLFQIASSPSNYDIYQKKTTMLGSYKGILSSNREKPKFSQVLKKLLDSKKTLVQKAFVFAGKKEDKKQHKRNSNNSLEGTNTNEKYIKVRINKTRLDKTRASDIPANSPEIDFHSISESIQTQTGSPGYKNGPKNVTVTLFLLVMLVHRIAQIFSNLG